jgi:hypothetical protein
MEDSLVSQPSQSQLKKNIFSGKFSKTCHQEKTGSKALVHRRDAFPY